MITHLQVGKSRSGKRAPAWYSFDSLQDEQMRLCAPCDGNFVKHIRQTRSTRGRAACSPGESLPAACPDAGRGFCIGKKLRLPVGLRPGAKRRGKPRRAARVMMAATERPRRSAICGGASPASHMVRNCSSCSTQLATAKPCPDCSEGDGPPWAVVPVVSVPGLCSTGLFKPVHLPFQGSRISQHPKHAFSNR